MTNNVVADSGGLFEGPSPAVDLQLHLGSLFAVQVAECLGDQLPALVIRTDTARLMVSLDRAGQEVSETEVMAAKHFAEGARRLRDLMEQVWAELPAAKARAAAIESERRAGSDHPIAFQGRVG